MGAQTCRADGTYGPCDCDVDAGSDAALPDAGRDSGSDACCDAHGSCGSANFDCVKQTQWAVPLNSAGSSSDVKLSVAATSTKYDYYLHQIGAEVQLYF